MTVFVNNEAAQNLAANRAPITNNTGDKLQHDVSSTYQGFFAERTNRVMPKVQHLAATATATATAASNVLLTSSATVSIADPTSLHRELDKRMKD
jgi:hypothetical protein